MHRKRISILKINACAFFKTVYVPYENTRPTTISPDTSGNNVTLDITRNLFFKIMHKIFLTK